MEIAYSATATKSIWLKAKQEQDAHFAFVISEDPKVSLTLESGLVIGQIKAVDGHTITFVPMTAYQDICLPDNSQKLRMDYSIYGITYSCFTFVVFASRSDFKLAYPDSIERSDRRFVHRHDVEGDSSFSLKLHGPWHPATRKFGLLNISTDGIAFYFNGNETPTSKGMIFAAELTIPEQKVEMLLRVNNVRFLDGVGIAGARYMDMNFQRRLNLALGISVWEHRKKMVA